MSRFQKSCLAMLIAICGSVSGTEYISLNGRLVQLAPLPPDTPLDASDCEEFRDNLRATLAEVGQAHDACLQNEQNSPALGGPLESDPHGVTNRCSKPACQELHDARSLLTKNTSNGYSSCMSALSERKLADSRGRTEDAASKFFEGPVSAVRGYVRRELGDYITSLLGPGSEYTRTGVNTAAITGAIWSKTDDLIEACKRSRDDEVPPACATAAHETLSDFARHVPQAIRADPAVGLIQRAMLERLLQMHGDLLEQTDELKTDIGTVSSDSATPRAPRKETGRSRGLIENR